MKTGNSFLFIALLFTAVPALAQRKYSRVRLQVPPQGLAWLQSQGVDFDHGQLNSSDSSFTTTLSTSDIIHLKKTGIPFTILIEDEAAHFTATNKVTDFYRYQDAMMVNGEMYFGNNCGSAIDNVPVPSAFTPGSYGGYYSFAQIQQKIKYLYDTYPDLVDTIVLPTRSTENRPLIVVKISDHARTDEDEPKALYTGLHHAREGMSMMNLFFFMEYLLENYNTDPRIKDLVDSRELFFLPCVNPDGYVFNETDSPAGGGGWRKNRRNNGGSYEKGVDLNRNYNVNWGEGGPNINISTNPNSDSYIGPYAFSEPETRAIRALAQSRHFTIAIDHHSYGNYYVTPFGKIADHTLTPVDSSFYGYASALMAKYNGYFAGDGMATVGYYAVGNSRDYHLIGDIGIGTKQKTYGYTVEIGPDSDGFWPPANHIIPIAKDMFFANMQMAYMAGSYFELQDLDKMAITASSGNFNFSLRRVGLTDAPVTVSLIPLENIASAGSPVTINSMPNYFDIVQRNIAYTLSNTIVHGSRIRFVYEISSGGITLRDTIIKYYHPIEILNDDMESTSNWQYNTNWGTTTAAAWQGVRSLSESPTGNYTRNEQSWALLNMPIDLSDATAARLSFWVKHNAENSLDKLQVQVSDYGTSNFQPVCGSGTVAELKGTLNRMPSLTGVRNIWKKETVDLGAFLGNNNVRLRFFFTSNSSNQFDGFYIDNVEIIKSSLIVLPLQFTDLQAHQVMQGVLVTWQYGMGDNPDHFDVQRSADGVHFKTIGTVKGQPPYQFTDPTPAAINYYRIMAVDRQNRQNYSRTVLVKNIQEYTLSITPNPATDAVYINFNLESPADYLLTVTDMMGRDQLTQKLHLGSGAGYRRVEASAWAPQVYWVKLLNLSTGQQTAQKIIKK